MSKFLKILLIYISMGILNTLIFIRYLESTGLPGGEIGMAPMGIILGSIFSLVISVIIYYLLQLKIKFNAIKSILLYEVIFLLVLILAFGGMNPFENEITNYKNITLWIYLTSFITTVIMIISYLIFKEIKTKTKKRSA
ncbi:MAG: hypothetical protein R3259_02735 [Salinimicrobium sediminis]|nr:hypothetical protein [Salinimicrobium sediminis]